MSGVTRSNRIFLQYMYVWPAALVSLTDASDQVTVVTRSLLKKKSDVVTLGTFCYMDQSFINRRGVGYFFHARRGTEPDPPQHTPKASIKNSDPL